MELFFSIKKGLRQFSFELCYFSCFIRSIINILIKYFFPADENSSLLSLTFVDILKLPIFLTYYSSDKLKDIPIIILF